MQEEIKQQAGKMLSQVAGYVGLRTIEMGLSTGLLAEINNHADGIEVSTLAENTKLDPFYVEVWARSAYASEVIELNNTKYKLAPHMDKLLLDEEFPGHIGGIFNVMLQPEFFDVFGKNFKSGKRLWWDECSPNFIQAVSNTGRSFYNRCIPTAFKNIPKLEEKLTKGAKVLELCCGAGRGLEKLTTTYPNCTFTGQDGDSHSLEITKKRLADAGTADKVSLIKSTMEDIQINNEFDVVFINISMHECRDIDKVTQNIYRALKENGMFVISDFPFPETTEDCRTVPARIMCGIQYFESLIGDQLLPTKTFLELLDKYKFKQVDHADITPVHAITWGTK